MHYKVTRIGLLNFWLYDEEEFDFEDGKLLLRGTNGSGKSVTMQSFIPLILDGNKAPSRLDPFGGKAKHIEDYLLGGIDNEKKEQSTGYLYMEVYLETLKKYLTIGMGLYAKQGRPTTFWGFALEDGRRIGKDFFLYKNKEEKIPLTKNELRSRLGAENKLVESVQEYKKMVNNLLFGFPNLDSYDEFISVLLQLRSPKLSKEYKPTILMDILSSVLKPLTEEDLRPLSEAIEEMDKTKENIEKLEEDLKQLSYLTKTYNNYNESFLYQKANSLIIANKNKNDIQNRLDTINKNTLDITQNLENCKEQFINLKLEKERLETQKANLDHKDLDSKINRLETLKEEIINIETKKEKSNNNLSQKIDKQKSLETEIKDLENTKFKTTKDITESLSDIKDICTTIDFKEPTLILKDLEKNIDTKIDFPHIKTRINNYKLILQTIQNKLKEKQTLEEKINERSENHTNLNKKYQELLQTIEKTVEEAENTLRELKDQIIYLSKTNKIIKLTDDDKNKIISNLNTYTHANYIKAKTIYETLSDTYQNNILEDYYRLKEKYKNEAENINKIKQELELLKTTEEEIELTNNDLETKEYLKNQNIKYLEFYKAIEFKENIEDTIKEKLEALLLNSGLLAAKIINPKDKQKVINHHGSYLIASKPKPNNLSKYLKPSTNETFTESEINDVLKSISTDEKDLIKINENSYQMDFLIGFSTPLPVKYIGALARKQERERKIKETNEKLEAAISIKDNLQNLLTQKEEELRKAKEEKMNFPSEENLFKINSEINKLETESTIINAQMIKEEEIIRNLTKEMDNLFKDLTHLKKDINLPLTLETYEEALLNTSTLDSLISTLENYVNSYNHINDMYQDKTKYLTETTNLIDQINEELTSLTHDLKRKENEKQDIETILSEDKYKDLSKKIIDIDTNLDKINNNLLKLQKDQGKYESDLENLKTSKDEIQKENQKTKEIYNLKEKIFLEEYNLNYITNEEVTNVITTAKKIVNMLSNRKDSSMTNVIQNYYSAYSDYHLKLTDYHLISNPLFDSDLETTLSNEEKTVIQNERERADLSAMYQGKKLNIYALAKALENSIEENNQIINEQDRRLFEEILLKTVGTKIRDRIESSKEWVKEMNTIMKDVQTESSLLFQLDWKSKSAQNMDELDTKELVRLFKIDSSTLTQTDSDKLINHFRSKLKTKIEENENHDSYANIIFDILDYRNWFEFKLSYQRPNENKKELTDKVFAVFSGGEKAKTMYIPLFAAVYAKLMSGQEKALRLVALDEAFAGVDDINIREMFGIMDYLNLDYILTSQALWGDYDTVKALGISELVRPNNATVVGVRRFRWNGKTKEVILNREIDDASQLF